MDIQTWATIGNSAFAIWVAQYMLTTQRKVLEEVKDAILALTIAVNKMRR